MSKKTYLTKSEMLSFAIKKRRSFEALVYIDCLNDKATKSPELTFTNGTHSKTSDKLISIGVGGFKAKDEKELYAQIVHMIGVQLQHKKSTTKRDWEAAEKLALSNICERIAKDELHARRRFLKESDYERFFEELEGLGIYISAHTIKELVSYIAGALEEGRVDRIHTEKDPGFLDYRRVARGLQYENQPIFPEGVAEIAYEDLNPAEKLKALQKQIYALATAERFQRGFLSNYIETPFYDEVREYIPLIAKAIMSPTCKECMGYAVDILDLMYDEIIAASKFKGGIEEMMKQMLAAQANAPDESELSATPSEEEKGSGDPPESLFGNSDLEVTLEDEDYDKLMQKQQNNPQHEEDGVNVKRKHDYDEVPPTCPPPAPSPSSSEKEEEGDSDKQGGPSGIGDNTESGTKGQGEQSSGEGTGNSTTSSEGTESSETGSGGGQSAQSDDGNEEDGQGSASSSAANANEEAGEDADQMSASSSAGDGEKVEDGDAEAASAGESSDNADGACQQDSSLENTTNGDQKEADKASGKISDHSASSISSNSDESSIMGSIEKAMEDAMKNIGPEIKRSEASEKYEKEFADKIQNFKTQPLADSTQIAKATNENYPYAVNFNEVERKYVPDLPLPYDLEAKGKSLKRKVEEIINNKQTPSQRGMRSGSIDGTRLHKLISSDTTIFKKRGQKDKPDVAGFLLLDNSGSMGNGPGSTRYYACNALSVIEEGFKEFMPLKIAAFDASGNDYVTHEVVKEFEEVAACNFAHNFCRKGRSGGGNKDGYSIRIAAKQLLERPEKDKVLIIASDGLPTNYYGNPTGREDVRAAVEEARKKGIKVIGMYMYSYADDNTFRDYHEMYREDYIMATMDDIEKELTRVLKRLFA